MSVVRQDCVAVNDLFLTKVIASSDRSLRMTETRGIVKLVEPYAKNTVLYSRNGVPMSERRCSIRCGHSMPNVGNTSIPTRTRLGSPPHLRRCYCVKVDDAANPDCVSRSYGPSRRIFKNVQFR